VYNTSALLSVKVHSHVLVKNGQPVPLPKPQSTGRLGWIPAWLHEKVPSDLGEWELLKLPVPGSRGHPVSAIVA
jgi:hypothetical protein